MTGGLEDSALTALVKAGASRYAAPSELEERIRARVSEMAAHEALPRAATRASAWPWSWLKLGTALACGLLVGVLATQLYVAQGGRARVTDEVVAAHVRSLMVAHLEDIASTDQHTVKPWFSGKLDFSPPVNDFSREGFPLTGGRLDYVDRRLTAALVYRRHGHTINLFVWPVRGGDVTRSLDTTRDGFNVIAWEHAGMQFWLVSDVNAAELRQFSQLVRNEGASPAL